LFLIFFLTQGQIQLTAVKNRGKSMKSNKSWFNLAFHEKTLPARPAFFFASCAADKVDTIIHHAVIYTVDSSIHVAEAMAVKDGKIMAVGKNDEIQKKYERR
jgi:hypothetical protein